MKAITLFCSLYFVFAFPNLTVSEVIEVNKGAIASEFVSIISLIANPEKYHGKHITVMGFAIVEYDGTALYLSEHDAKQLMFKNAIWLHLSSYKKYNELNKTYVIVEGVFDKSHKGPKSGFSGSIDKIERFHKWLSRSDM